MLCIQSESPDHMTIGTTSLNECMGLLFLGLGILFATLAALTALGHFELTELGALSAVFSIQIVVPMSIAGAIMVFGNRKFILYRPLGMAEFRQGYFKLRIWKWTDIQAVTFARAHPASKFGLIGFDLGDGAWFLITRGPADDARNLADRIAVFLDRPITETVQEP